MNKSNTNGQMSNQQGRKGGRRRSNRRRPNFIGPLNRLDIARDLSTTSYNGPMQGRGRPPRPRQEQRASVAAAYATRASGGKPIIRGSHDRVTIRHKEFLSNIYGNLTWAQVLFLALNPGLPNVFPWLATQAQSWQRYKFKRLCFRYLARCGSSQQGSVQMVPDYDAADVAPQSEAIASNYQDVVEDAPWKDLVCELDVAAMHPKGVEKFIRVANLAANLDVKTYDVGNFFLATTDSSAAAAPFGKLWVEYEVELITPQLNAQGISIQQFQLYSSPTPTSASPFGNAANPPAELANSANLVVVAVASSVVTFLQAGMFLVTLQYDGTTCSVAAPVLSANALSYFFQSGGNGTSNYVSEQILTATVGSTITYAVTLTAGAGVVLMVTQLPGAFENESFPAAL